MEREVTALIVDVEDIIRRKKEQTDLNGATPKSLLYDLIIMQSADGYSRIIKNRYGPKKCK